jgi:hypothetical protein
MAMELFPMFLGIWALALLAGAHFFAERDIAFGQDLPEPAAWSVRLAYIAATGGVSLVVLWLAAEFLIGA